MNNDDIKRRRLPEWIRVKPHSGGGRSSTDKILKDLGLHTVCESARCPNLGECWHKRTATFLIMGNICTRNCRFCSVPKGNPLPPDAEEPSRVAEAAGKMNLRYVVVTSVTRDDLDDGGASIFAETIRQIRNVCGDKIMIEVLVPDFNCDQDAIRTVLNEGPAVFNHNIETVRRLSKEIRLKADYDRSMNVLKTAFDLVHGRIPVKSGLMVGMGETDDEVISTILDLRENGVTMLTIGQYLPPEKTSWTLHRYVEPCKFEEWKKFALSNGFINVASGPLVRSSYCAEELHEVMR